MREKLHQILLEINELESQQLCNIRMKDELSFILKIQKIIQSLKAKFKKQKGSYEKSIKAL